MTTSMTKDALAAHAVKLAEGTAKNLSSLAVMPLDGATDTPAEVEAKLKGFAKLRLDADVAKAVWETALKTADAQQPAMVAYMAAVTRFVRAAFGNAADVLVDFGIEPIKPRTPLTVDEQAAAVAKREATRKARGTLGPRQKLAIHGDVTGVTVTPITNDAPPAPAAPKAKAAPAVAAPESSQK